MADTGSIVTVDGRMDPEELGLTSTHEHTFLDMASAWFEPPAKPRERKIARGPVSQDVLHYVRQFPMQHEDNIRLESFDQAVEEVSRFSHVGGDTIVDVTPKGIQPDPESVRAVARETGVNYVHGTAYYTQGSHPNRVADLTVDDLETEFVEDVRDGIGDTDVRAGIIGEIGISNTMHDDEEKVLRAGARAAVRTGAPISVHPPHYDEKPLSRWSLEILDILEEEDLAPERVILCHQDQNDAIETPGLDYQKEIAERGAYVEFDLWGWGMFDLVTNNHASPSDNWRIRATIELIEEGYASNLVFAQDVCTKAQRCEYGGFGYEHVLRNVVPRLRSRDVSREAIDQILVENPKRVLAFDEPAE